jgi:hypothetical protein
MGSGRTGASQANQTATSGFIHRTGTPVTVYTRRPEPAHPSQPRHASSGWGAAPLVVYIPLTLAADTEAVTQAVQLPRPALSPPVQDDHQISRDRVGSDPLWCDAVGGIQIADHVRVP